MASHRELNKLTTNMNTIPSNGRPSRNSQGIHNMFLHPIEYTASQSDQQHTPVNTPLPRNVLTSNNPKWDSTLADTPSSQRQVESFTPCVRQNVRFVDSSGKPLQPGTVIIGNKILFVVSNNGKIYNFTGGSFKQLYVTDPSEYKFLVSLANSPSTFSSIINSVISLLPSFGSKQTNDNIANEKQIQTVIETSNTEAFNNNDNVILNVSTDTIADVDVSEFTDISTDAVHHEHHDNMPQHENLFQDSIRNEMLTHYNRIVIGSFKEFSQSININNLAEVLHVLKELNFVVANRAPELALYYNMPLEPWQITAEEVPNLVRAHLNHTTAYNMEHSVRGRPRSRGNQHHWYSRQLSLLPRYNQHSERSETCFHLNRNYSYTHHHVISQHNSPHTFRNTPNTVNNLANPVTAQSPNTSNIIESLQSQIIGLQTQALQQSTLNSIKIFDGNNKSKFTLWMQSVANAAKLCNVDTLTIALSKLQGPPLKSACFLELKEVSSGKQLNWHSLKKHLTTNYLEIPYDTHAINAYNNLHQGSDESTSAYLHRAQDILEHIHNTSNMTSIPAIGTNHAKILTGLRDSRLCNKLAESKAKKWTTMCQVLQDVADMVVDFRRSCGYSLPTFEAQYVSPTNSSSSYRSNKPATRNIQQLSNWQEKPKCWFVRQTLQKGLSNSPQTKFPPKYKSTKDKQHNLIKVYHTKFQDRRQINELYTPVSAPAKNSTISFQNSRTSCWKTRMTPQHD